MISGLPFFAPLFASGNEWHIYGPRGLGQSLEEIFELLPEELEIELDDLERLADFPDHCCPCLHATSRGKARADLSASRSGQSWPLPRLHPWA